MKSPASACATGSRRKTTPSPTRAERFTFAAAASRSISRRTASPTPRSSCSSNSPRRPKVDGAPRRDVRRRIVNMTEHRAALHTALRSTADDAPFQQQVRAEKAKMAAFADQVRDGSWTGYTGKRIRHVVNIGIGGSDLGPKMVVHALHHLASPETRYALRLQRRWRRPVQRAADHRRRRDARDHRVEDVHDARNDDQRPLDARLVHQDKAAPKTRCRSTSSACRRIRRKSSSSASRKRTSSRCGTGSAGAIRCGRR